MGTYALFDSLGQTAIAVNTPTSVSWAARYGSGEATSCRVGNQSPWLLTVDAGFGPLGLQPWQQDVFDVSPGCNAITIQVVQLGAQAPQNYPSSAVTVDLALAGSVFPGSYPAAITPTQLTVGQINAGSVTVGGSVVSSSPQAALAAVTDNSGPGPGTTATRATSNAAQALAVQISDISKISHLKVVGLTTGTVYLELYYFAQSIYAFPYLAALETAGVQLSVSSSAGGVNVTVTPVELRESVPEFLQLFAPPQLAPNQLPKTLSAQANANSFVALIPETTNVQLFLFTLALTAVIGAGVPFFRLWIGTLASPNQTQIGEFQIGNNTPLPLDLKGAPLTRGQGLYAFNTDLGNVLSFRGVAALSKG